MGEGLYRSDDGRTAYAEPYDGLDPDDYALRDDADDAFVRTIRDQLSTTWWAVEREWRGRTERIVARNRLHEVWLVQDSYDRVHVTFGVRADLDETDGLARSLVDDRAEAFFDRLQMSYPLRVRTSAWTNAARLGRRVAA